MEIEPEYSVEAEMKHRVGGAKVSRVLKGVSRKLPVDAKMGMLERLVIRAVIYVCESWVLRKGHGK